SASGGGSTSVANSEGATIKNGITITNAEKVEISNLGNIQAKEDTGDTGDTEQGITVSADSVQISNSGNIQGKVKSTASKSDVVIINDKGTISGGVSASSQTGNAIISNSEGATIKNGITIEKAEKVEISNLGNIQAKEDVGNTESSNTEQGITVSADKVQISNSGNIQGKVESTSQGDIIISNSNKGTISGGVSASSQTGSAIITNSEEGMIKNGITIEKAEKVEISNLGTVGKNSDGNTITNNSDADVAIKEWFVPIDENGNLEKLTVADNGKGNVKVESITIDQGNLDLEQVGDINNIVSGVKQDNIGNIGTNGSGEISLSYDPISGRVSTDIRLNQSIAGATFRSLISTTTRRSTFIDTVMGNAMKNFSLSSSTKFQKIAMSEKGNLYASASDYIKSDLNNGTYGSSKEHSLFILPYASSQNVELSLGEESKGHTKGIIAGYSTVKDTGIYGVYAGYEDTKMSS
ncbi:hypothetical protein KJK76_001879, partial [Campylobacter jejuni]|nr:hypothetical protein [Campylobacter jejuni]